MVRLRGGGQNHRTEREAKLGLKNRKVSTAGTFCYILPNSWRSIKGVVYFDQKGFFLGNRRKGKLWNWGRSRGDAGRAVVPRAHSRSRQNLS